MGKLDYDQIYIIFRALFEISILFPFLDFFLDSSNEENNISMRK